MQYEEELRKYGLSEKEAKVYLVLLRLGPSSVNDISEAADLVRTTTYDVLKKLREEGIVASMILNNIQTFEASSPEKLIHILDERKKHILPILNDLKKLKIEAAPKSRAEIFEGKHGMKTVFDFLIENKKPLYAYSNNQFMVDLLPIYGPRFIKDRVKEKIKIKIISESSETTNKLLKSKDKIELRETRTLEEFKKIPINQYISGDTVAILGSRQDEPVGILIHNKDFAEEQRIIFNELWKISKK
ncbi:MAG: TrmB family transcriptional regulator [Candidatus Woesearchaeota archaeon]